MKSENSFLCLALILPVVATAQNSTTRANLLKLKIKLVNFAPFILSHVHHLPHVQAHFLSFHTNSSGMIPIRGQTLSRSQPFLIFFPTNHPIFFPLYHQIHYTKRSYLHTFHITFDRPPISLVLPIYHIQHLQLWDPNTR